MPKIFSNLGHTDEALVITASAQLEGHFRMNRIFAQL